MWQQEKSLCRQWMILTNTINHERPTIIQTPATGKPNKAQESIIRNATPLPRAERSQDEAHYNGSDS